MYWFTMMKTSLQNSYRQFIYYSKTKGLKHEIEVDVLQYATLSRSLRTLSDYSSMHHPFVVQSAVLLCTGLL